MVDIKPEELHNRHCMLHEFRKSSNATTATKNLCGIYLEALDARRRQRRYAKFRSGIFYLYDVHLRRFVTPDNGFYEQLWKPILVRTLGNV